MQVKCLGGDEGDRWKRTAVLASLMAHTVQGLSFHDKVPPHINYTLTKDVTFALDIDACYPHKEFLMKKMWVLIYANTMIADPAEAKGDLRPAPERYEERVIRGETLRGYKGLEVNQFKKTFGLETIDDWAGVPEKVFADSLYLNLYLIDHFTAKNDSATVEKIARASEKGLQYYGLSDYDGRGLTGDRDLYLSKYTSSPTSSLKAGIDAARAHLSQISKDTNPLLDAEQYTDRALLSQGSK